MTFFASVEGKLLASKVTGKYCEISRSFSYKKYVTPLNHAAQAFLHYAW